MQTIIWPWNQSRWPTIQDKLSEKIRSIVDVDSRISSINFGRLKTREITNLFTLYFDQETNPVSQDILVDKIFPMMQQLILNGPLTFRNTTINALTSGIAQNVTLNRLQIATIMSCLWFGLFNYNYISAGKSTLDDFTELSFVEMFIAQHMFGLSCIVNYFDYVSTNLDTLEHQLVVFKRTVLNSKPQWKTYDLPCTEVVIGDCSPDDSPAKLRTVYSHEYISDNMFKNAITQEEISMLVYPDAFIAPLLCAKTQANETITCIGVEKISAYQSCGTSIKYTGRYIDTLQKKHKKDVSIVQSALVFIDASPKLSKEAQLYGEFTRDLNKAYCGFTSIDFSEQEYVSCGIWSYAKSNFASSNNIQVKFIQLVLSASLADKCLIYHPADPTFEYILIPFITWLGRNNMTIGRLYEIYTEIVRSHLTSTTRIGDIDLFTQMMRDY